MKKGIITFLDENKKEIERISINKLPYKRDIIVKKSIELYDEEDPCIIYSTFCSNILGEELLTKINMEYSDEENIVFIVDDELFCFKDIIDMEENIKFIKIE